LTLHERDTPSTSSTRAQVRSGEVCLRSLGADTAASIIAPHTVRCRIWTLANNQRALGTATHRRARTGLLTIQRPY
jgi:hypothetical protein